MQDQEIEDGAGVAHAGEHAEGGSVPELRLAGYRGCGKDSRGTAGRRIEQDVSVSARRVAEAGASWGWAPQNLYRESQRVAVKP